MALNKVQLKADILGILTDMEQRDTDAKDEFATRLSNAIDAYVKTGQVMAGIPVATAGTAASQTGATTAPASIT